MKNARYIFATLLMLAVPAWAQETSATSNFNSPTASLPVPGSTAEQQAQVDDNAQKYALAHQLVELTDFANNFKSGLDIMGKVLMPLIVKQNPNNGAKVQEIVMTNLGTSLMGHIEEIKNNSATIYANMYTKDELIKIIAFYQSDVGQKMIKTAPQVLQNAMALNHNIITAATKEALGKIVEQLKANGLIVPKEMGI